MNKRLKNKIEKRRRKQICKVLDMCLQINGLQKSKQELTADHPTAFLYFSGHVALIEAQIYPRGWNPHTSECKNFQAYIDYPGELEQLLEQLKNETPGAATPRESR